ncbi:MAG: ATP-binding cassette domain-containing protein [Prevotellaceae bacterium]|jgi:ABC-type lipoprotein export system ATPase subunit|nr:ATP-binding cassette domain-containing protein [Prevotellaceae bacterium]
MESITLNGLHPSSISNTDPASVFEPWFNDIRFDKGKNCLITAPSGHGKSSLFAFIFGERNDYSGNIAFDARNIASLKQNEWRDIRRRSLSCVFQGLRLFSDLTVRENIELKNKITGHKSAGEIELLAAKAGIENKINEKVGRLSFGQQQRVATIRALCQPFDFILLDEPFSHLDEKNIEIMSELISAETKRQNAGIILCSLGYEYPFRFDSRLGAGV